MSYTIKNIGELIVKDVDMKEGIVTGYASRFGNVDSDGDIMEKGCYQKTISENGPTSGRPRIAHLWMHSSYEPVGKLLELMEDDYGLLFRSKLSKSNRGKDALALYEEGIINEHSVGFQGVKFEDDIKDESKPWDRIRTFKEVKLWEVSSVVFGANPDTPTIGVKDLNPEQAANVIKRLENMERTLRKGTGLTDDAFRLLEIECAQIRKELSPLQTEEPPTHSEENEPDILKMWREITSTKN